MSRTSHAFDFLSKPQRPVDAPAIVVFGDESFLRRQVLSQLLQLILGGEDIPFASLEGRTAEWRDVADELATVSLFGSAGTRLVVVDEADDFVSRHRSQLEDHLARERHAGCLILLVKSWASNTRLYKQIDKSGFQVECRAPQKKSGRNKSVDTPAIERWLVGWCRQAHQAVLDPHAAKQLIELIGLEFGLLDQELAKLALFAGIGGDITVQMVNDVVGGWRTKTIWEIVDAAADGNSDEALVQLDRLLRAGENPLALFGQLAWSLRRFATATRFFEQSERLGRRVRLDDALEVAGFPKWSRQAMDKSKRQLQQLGRQRAGNLYRALLEADLALKGTHSTPHRARFVLENLLVRMSNQVGKSPAAPR